MRLAEQGQVMLISPWASLLGDGNLLGGSPCVGAAVVPTTGLHDGHMTAPPRLRKDVAEEVSPVTEGRIRSEGLG